MRLLRQAKKKDLFIFIIEVICLFLQCKFISMRYNKRVNRLLIFVQKISSIEIIIENSQLAFKLRILFTNMRAWTMRNALSNKSKLKNFLINIHTQLNCLIEIQYNILNIMRQRINFSFIFMKQFDSNEFENELKVDFNDDENVVMTEQI